MPPHLPHRAPRALVRIVAAARRRRSGGEIVVGHHNRNIILPLGQPLAFLLRMESGRVRAKFRVPRETLEVVPRIWSESEVLKVVNERLGDVPRCLIDLGEWSLHDYIEGRALSEVEPEGPVGQARIAALAAFFARLADVPVEELPERPSSWPDADDSQGFLCRLAAFAEKVHDDHRPRFWGLFASLGIPDDLVGRFVQSVPELTRRPFSLLHTDVHRANVVVTSTADGERLSVLDWELSLYGDPLHDLATHLVRMKYTEAEQELMTQSWADAQRQAGHRRKTAGLEQDLPVYLGFEYVQSVFPDVMRAALALPAEPAKDDFETAARQVHGALRRAWRPLGEDGKPMWDTALVDEAAAVRELRRWHAEERARGFGAPEDPGLRPWWRRKEKAGWCPAADRPRGIDTAPPIRQALDRGSGTEAGESLESLERHVS